MDNKFDALSLIGPGIGAIGSIVGGLFGKKGSDNAAKIQYKIAQETNANNYRIAQENNAFNERMVDKQNEWNSAKNQRARLEEAGLNPYLMLDGGSVKDSLSLNGQSSISGFTGGLSDSDQAGQGWFSAETRDALDSVSSSSSYGLKREKGNSDIYNMAGFSDHYSWLYGD